MDTVIPSETVRAYWRCPDCLSVYATDVPRPATGRLDSVHHLRPYTPVCGPCAVGPCCDCKCRGENHGDLLARKIVVLETRGTVPVDTLDDPKATARASEYSVSRAAAEAAWTTRYGEVCRRKAAGEFLGGADFRRYLDAGQAMRRLCDARAMKTHKARMAKLAAVLTLMNGGSP